MWLRLLTILCVFLIFSGYAKAQTVGATAAPATPVPEGEILDEAKAKERASRFDKNMRQRGIGRERQGQDISIFAYPGTECPPGSNIYKGPETKLAAPKGVVYCVLVKRVIVLPKTRAPTCPPIMKAYTHPDVQPDADVIWCEMVGEGFQGQAGQSGQGGQQGAQGQNQGQGQGRGR